MRFFVSLLAGLIVFAGYIPYAYDIIKGRAMPARSARVMFVLLLSVALAQQWQLGATLTLAVTVGELLGSIAILALSLKRGVGGLRRLDLICYGLLLLDVILWLSSGQALLALWLSVLADVIAFFPTLHKTWRRPASETPLFFVAGTLAPLLNLAATHLTLGIALYPAALTIENAIEIGLIYRLRLGRFILKA